MSSKTGVHNMSDNVEPGVQAEVWGCEHYRCRGNGWHSPDCAQGGMLRSDKELARTERTARGKVRRHTVKEDS
jgi:hypothetical protein